MKIEAVCEYNRGGYLIYAANFPGAYVRGETKDQAMAKFPSELHSYLCWSGIQVDRLHDLEIDIVQEKESELQICDADSDVLFDREVDALTDAQYQHLKMLVLRSARDFHTIFAAIENPNISDLPHRQSFYGSVPRTPRQMYEHTNRTTAYYASAFGIDLVNVEDIYENRMQILSKIEATDNYLSNQVYVAPDGERWTVRKLLRRFLWHDRIHAKAMWRLASRLWGNSIPNPFFFL